VHGADPCAREHRNGDFRNHRQVYRDAIALACAQRLQSVRALANALVEFPVTDVFRDVRIVTLPNDRGLVAARFQVAVQTIARDIQSPVVEPTDVAILV